MPKSKRKKKNKNYVVMNVSEITENHFLHSLVQQMISQSPPEYIPNTVLIPKSMLNEMRKYAR